MSQIWQANCDTMKNRTYKRHNRSIKEVRLGIWQCRIIPKNGATELAPFETDSKDGAFNWLRGGSTNNTSLDHANAKARRRVRRTKK